MSAIDILNDFEEIWFFDFEYSNEPGETVQPICLVARELKSDKLLRIWEDELQTMKQPPYNTGSESLFIAYYAPAEISCHLALYWPVPDYIVDLYAEFRTITNGTYLPHGRGLLGAMSYFGLCGIDTIEKTEMRDLALRGGPWTGQEKSSLLDYCHTDVEALCSLFPLMLPKIKDIRQSILRGMYMACIGEMEFVGIPIDIDYFISLQEYWDDIRDELIKEVDKNYGVFDGHTFKQDLFTHYLASNCIEWPRLPSGSLDLKDETFKQQSKAYPQLSELRELRGTLSKMKLNKLSIGKSGRNRCMLSPFSSITGRNQPSTSKFVFGPSTWIRGLIKPSEGMGIAYIDWSQQEFGIAAALSGDKLMQEAYSSGDPYLAFAIQAKAVPENATKHSHKLERSLFKECVLAVQYGMGEEALANRINQSVAKARELLTLHKETYRTFWRWSDAALDSTMLSGSIMTVFGWQFHVANNNANPRSIRNFPMQANGSEMLRLACIMIRNEGITVCCPVHDAVLIEAPLDKLDTHIATVQKLMEEASSIVLDGFKLKSDVDVVRHPNRYMDERGEAIWRKIYKLLNKHSSNVWDH